MSMKFHRYKTIHLFTWPILNCFATVCVEGVVDIYVHKTALNAPNNIW
jgi:hypothetical protein